MGTVSLNRDGPCLLLFQASTNSRRNEMPVILWLLGVPAVVVVILLLLNVI